MLASDEEGATLDALRFSLATDIVELVVLTADEIFLQTLREAVGGARRLWHVASAEKVSDLLVAGEVGILVVDVEVLNDAPPVFIGQIKRQFPDLVVEVAGNREAETALAGLISAGAVYRFIHKPMSPARARSFADAAVKKYDEQRKRAAAPPPVRRQSRPKRGVLAGGAIGALLAVVTLATWVGRRSSEQEPGPRPVAGVARPSPEESPILAQAAAALAANRLTEPTGESALDLYGQALAREPANAAAGAGLAEVRERLLARAENSLLEERLDEAAAAIAAARTAGADGARITFMSAQLAKSRARMKTAFAEVRAHDALKAEADKLTSLLGLATQRINDAQLIEPDGDSARFYVQEALRLDPNSTAAQEAQKLLATQLLAQARGAIDARDVARAAELLSAADGIAPAADIAAAQGLLAGARGSSSAADSVQLLKNATERMQQDRLEEAASIGLASPDMSALQHDLGAAVAGRNFLANVVDAGALTLVKSVNPVYPGRAAWSKTEGWVELDFTVTESGSVQDIAVHAASAAGVFEESAVKALSQWRYKPVLRGNVPQAQRARIRIRFVLAK